MDAEVCVSAVRGSVRSSPATRRSLAGAIGCLVMIVTAVPAGAAVSGTTRVSVSSDATQANARSTRPAISADGRFVAFGSDASTLVAGDTNGQFDIFVHDRETGRTERVSVSTQGTQATRASFSPSISADGRVVGFSSHADNLVPGDTNGVSDVFVHDRLTGTTRRVTVSSAGVQSDKYSSQASLSADGRYVAFTSHSSRLVAGDRNSEPDSFVHDTVTGATVRASVRTDGADGRGGSHSPWLSADGSVVVFYSTAPDLVAGDTNGVADVFVRDLRAGTTKRVSVSTTGTQANGLNLGPTLSGDGRFVAFSSKATNLVANDRNGNDDVYVHDRTTGSTVRVSATPTGGVPNGRSRMPAFDSSGRYLAYSSSASNLVPDDTNAVTDVFRLDRSTGATVRLSVATGGAQANGPSAELLDAGNASVSVTGAVAFYSDATNLVPRDTNATSDIFVAQPEP